jgi:nucleoside-diphosphate-sugar epimerase
MEGENRKGTVCVTGGTGFLASWLIFKLLERGYSVNTTIRSSPGLFSLYKYAYHVFSFTASKKELKKLKIDANQVSKNNKVRGLKLKRFCSVSFEYNNK